MKKKDRRNSDHKGPMARFVAEPYIPARHPREPPIHAAANSTRSGILHLCFLALDLSTPNSRNPATIYRQKITEEKVQLTHLIYRIMAQSFR